MFSLLTLILRCSRSKCLASSLGMDTWCTMFCFPGLMLCAWYSALHLPWTWAKCFSHYLKALCAYFYISIYHNTGICVCWSNYISYLEGQVHWTETAVLHKSLNCFHTFHYSKHFLLDYESQIYMFTLCLFCEYQGFITLLLSSTSLITCITIHWIICS